MIKFRRLRVLAAGTALAAALTIAGPSFASLAATGTVTASDVNVRGDATTSADIVGKATAGDSFDLGESKDDADGATWYQITLSDGTVGYIRSDFIEISEDSDNSSSASTEDESSASASTDTSSTDTGDYQIVLAPDENGTMTYYLYNNAANERMKLSDIEALQQQVQTLQTQASSVASRYRILLIVLAVLLVIAVVIAIMLFVRLRDALTNGRRERDLTGDRARERRTDRNADNLNDLKRRDAARGGQAPAGRRQEPYASGQKRPEGTAQRTAQAGQRTAQARPASGTGTQTRTAAPSAQGERLRTDRPAASTQTRRPVTGGTAQNGTAARPQTAQGQTAAQQRPTRPQSRNFADSDDDFDYDFISLDDDKK